MQRGNTTVSLLSQPIQAWSLLTLSISPNSTLLTSGQEPTTFAHLLYLRRQRPFLLRFRCISQTLLPHLSPLDTKTVLVIPRFESMETIPPHYFTHSEMAHSHYSQLRFSGLSSASSAASWYEAQRASPSTCSTGNAHSRSHVSGIGVSQYNECTPSTRPRRLSSPRVSRRSSSGKDGIPTNSIPHLREALSSLDSQMATLMSEKRKLESHLEQAVRLQSPVLRLPRELLGSIFITGVLLDEDDRLLVSTLMLVCKEWAEVALNTPQLWSRITICDKHSMMKACKKLDRSKSVPLDIGVRFNPQLGQDEATTELVIRTIDILRPSIRRWRTFRLAVPYRIHAYIALKELNEQAPLLEDFAVQVHHLIQDDKRSQLSFPLFGGYTPRLRSSAFTSFNFDWDMHLVSRLRVLKLGGFYNSFAPSVPTLLNILRACPDLEELAFRNMSDVENAIACPEYSRTDETEHASMLNKALYPKASDMIELPRLKKASFYYAGIERVQSIFSQLAFPALEELEFCYMDNVTPVLRHLKRQTFTSFPLKHLRIESCYFNELKLVKLLGRLKSLQVLELVEVDDISSNFLGVSTCFSTNHCLERD